MIEEIGTVIEESDDIAVISVERKEACSGCSARNFCRPFEEDENSVEITAINEIKAKKGDRVIVAIPEKQFLKASFITYIVPVCFLIIGAFTGEIAFKNDIITFISASFFFMLSFFIINRYSNKKKYEYLPKIIDKV